MCAILAGVFPRDDRPGGVKKKLDNDDVTRGREIML